jgi:hypothetical protein
MHLGGHYWNRYFRNVFLREVRLFAQLAHRALPSDEEMSAKADDAVENLSNLGDEDADLSDLYESAHNEGIEVYSALVHLRQGVINLFALGLYHMFEQQAFVFYRRALKRSYAGRVELELVCESLKDGYDIDVTKLNCWLDIKLLKLVANCAKHSEGSTNEACARLRAVKPQFFVDNHFDIENDFVETEAIQPLGGDGLYIRIEDFYAMARAVTSFWLELGAAIEGRT